PPTFGAVGLAAAGPAVSPPDPSAFGGGGCTSGRRRAHSHTGSLNTAAMKHVRKTAYGFSFCVNGGIPPTAAKNTSVAAATPMMRAGKIKLAVGNVLPCVR